MDLFKNGLIARESSGWAIVWALLLIALGITVIVMPVATSLVTVVVLGWFVIVAGFTHLFSAWRPTNAWSALWTVLVSVAYFIAGTALWTHPLAGAATLTLVVSLMFAFEGFVAFAAYIMIPSEFRSGWILVNGVITLILAWTIWSGWPGSSLWVIGTLVGVNLIVTGTSRLALSLALRRVVNEA